MRVLILGTGGIGRALAHHSTEQGDTVYTISKNGCSDNIKQPIGLNLDSPQTFSDIANMVCDLKIEVIVNTLGILHQGSCTPEKSISHLNDQWFLESMKVNCLSSLLLLKELNHILPKDSQLKFVALSARVGSISDNHLGGWLSYRASKAALNMGLKTAAIEWRYKHPNAIIVGYHPGTVDTKLSKPFQSNVKRLFTPIEAASYLHSFIDSLTQDMSGQLYSWQKQKIPF